MRPDISMSPAQLRNAAAMRRPAHHLVGGAERIHDIKGKQRDVWGLEHVAAGVEHEVGRLVRRRN
jgi:hypothetical protein